MAIRTWRTPREQDLALRRVGNGLGLGISILANGSGFAIEHRSDGPPILINQVLASTIAGGIGRILVRSDGAAPAPRTQVTLHLLRDALAWIWRIGATNASGQAIRVDSILLQDLGLGTRAFVTNNEAYASQYIDHHVAH